MSKVKDINGNEIDFQAAVTVMDEELREQVNSMLAPCTDQQFIEAYAEAHEAKYDEPFAPYAGLAW